MKRMAVSALLVGAVLAMGADVTEKEPENPESAGADTFRDSLYFSERPAIALALGDLAWSERDSRLDPILLAQDINAPVPRSAAKSGPDISLSAHNNEVRVGLSQEFSTWSDISAVFRPSRWKNPFREGGTLSWLNYKAWGNAPGRTAKVLLGEAIVVGAIYAVIEATESDGVGDRDGGTTPPPSTSSTSSSGSSSNSGGRSSSSSGKGGTSSSSGSSSNSAGVEMPW